MASSASSSCVRASDSVPLASVNAPCRSAARNALKRSCFPSSHIGHPSTSIGAQDSNSNDTAWYMHLYSVCRPKWNAWAMTVCLHTDLLQAETPQTCSRSGPRHRHGRHTAEQHVAIVADAFDLLACLKQLQMG